MNSNRLQRQFRDSAPVRIILLVLWALALLPLAANARSLFVPRRVVVTILKDSLAVGDSIAATAITYGPQGTPTADGTMAWSVTPVGCAAIRVPVGTSARSVVATGKLAGKCVVTGLWQQYGAFGRDSLKVYTKTPPTPVVTSVTVGLSSSTLTVGETEQAAAIIRDQNSLVMTGQAVGWSTSAPSVATVTGSGVVSAVGAGTASVRATVSGVIGSATLTVSAVVPTPAPTGTVAQLITGAVCLRAGTPVTVTTTCPTTDTATRFVVPDINVNGAIGALSQCLADSAGVSIILASCNGSIAQQWRRAGYTGPVTHIASGKCLASSAGRAILYTCGQSGTDWTTEPIQVAGGGGGGGPTQPPPTSTCTSADSAVARLSHPHEPTGMTPLYTHAAIVPMPCGWFNAVGQISIVDDPEKGKALQFAMSPMTCPGCGTARIDTWPEVSTFGATKLYVAFWEKLSPNFKANNGAGGLKNVIVKSQGLYYNAFSSGYTHIPGFRSDPTNVDGPITVSLETDDIAAYEGRIISPDVIVWYAPFAANAFQRGQWHFIESVISVNSRGVADGAFQTWIDGVSYPVTAVGGQFVEGTVGSRIRSAFDGVARFTGVEITNVWGGGGTAIPADNYYRFKDIYISGGYVRTGEAPTRWALKSQEGASVSAGSVVHITAQLVDANGTPVDICGLAPGFSVTNSATWVYWNGEGVYVPPTGCEHGQQLYAVTVPSGGTTITVADYAMVWNGQRGQARTGSLTITTK